MAMKFQSDMLDQLQTLKGAAVRWHDSSPVGYERVERVDL